MNLNTLIKREIAIKLLTISFVFIGLFAFSYALFFDIDEGESNVISFGDIDMSLCSDETCNTTVSNLGNIIGTKDDGEGNMVPQVVYPMSNSAGLDTIPYKFILENTGDYDLYAKIKLEPDTDFILSDIYPNYTDFSETDYSNIKVAFGEEGLTPTIMNFSELNEFVVGDNILLEKGKNKVFEVYAWVDEKAPNSAQGTYFITSISVIGEFIPD